MSLACILNLIFFLTCKQPQNHTAMKKITLKSVKETFREKLLNEQEMDLLKGGDGYNTELKYPCTGRYVNGQATPPGDIFAFSS